MLDRVKAYYRLTKPGIVYGNLLTAAAGFLLASKQDIDPELFVAAVLGTGLVIATGCVFNNYIDRGIDKKMKRTSKRALATGQIPGAHALIFGTVLGLAGFGLLAAFTNALTLGIGIFALFMYVVVYGYFKRHSTLGTLVGSIPGATPPVAGYVAVTGSMDPAAWLLFLIMVIWQMPHFYAIAIFRRDEYAAAGLPIMSVKKGIPVTKIHMIVWAVAYALTVPLLTFAGYTGFVYLLVMGSLAIIWLWRSIRGVRVNNNVAWARSIFGFSLLILLAFSVTLGVDAWLL